MGIWPVFFSASYGPECIPCCTTRSYHFLPMCCLLHLQHVTTSVLWIWTHACANIIPKPVCRVLETRLVSLWPYLKIVGNPWTSANMTPLLQIDYRQLFTQFITCNQMLQQYEHSSHYACTVSRGNLAICTPWLGTLSLINALASSPWMNSTVILLTMSFAEARLLTSDLGTRLQSSNECLGTRLQFRRSTTSSGDHTRTLVRKAMDNYK